MINKAALPVCTEFAQVAAHQSIDHTGEHCKQEQGHGQRENGQAHHEREDREQGRQQVVLASNVCLSKLSLQ